VIIFSLLSEHGRSTRANDQRDKDSVVHHTIRLFMRGILVQRNFALLLCACYVCMFKLRLCTVSLLPPSRLSRVSHTRALPGGVSIVQHQYCTTGTEYRPLLPPSHLSRVSHTRALPGGVSIVQHQYCTTGTEYRPYLWIPVYYRI
jgi:hypothetical protein